MCNLLRMKSYCLYHIINIDSLGYNHQVQNLLYYFILPNIFFRFHRLISKTYKFIELPFEKPHQFLHRRYKSNRIFLHLRQWQIANETVSLIHLHYAQIKRNPE